jgi:hypothetical protein
MEDPAQSQKDACVLLHSAVIPIHHFSQFLADSWYVLYLLLTIDEAWLIVAFVNDEQ